MVFSPNLLPLALCSAKTPAPYGGYKHKKTAIGNVFADNIYLSIN